MEKFYVGGLFLRMPWREGIAGEVINADGKKNGEAEGQRARWNDIGIQIDGRKDKAHIAILDHPENADSPVAWRVDNELGIGPGRQSAEQFWQSGGSAAWRQRAFGYSRRMARRIAIVEDDAAIRANYAEALTQARLRGRRLRRPARGDGRAAHPAAGPRDHRHRPGRRGRRRLRAVPRAARAVAAAADRVPHRARHRLRRRLRPAPGRRRLPHQGREPAAPDGAHRRAVPPRRARRRGPAAERS